MKFEVNAAGNSRPKILLVNRAILENEVGEILLIQRSTKDTYMPGKWEFPGGKLDLGLDISGALEREVLEETGLNMVIKDQIAYWTSKLLTTGKYEGFLYVELVGRGTSLGSEVLLSEEHDAFAWVKKEDVLTYDLVDVSKESFKMIYLSNDTRS